MSDLYESKAVAKIVGIPERTLRYWATTKIIIPAKDAVGRPGIRRLYSFENLIEAAILRELLKQNVTISLAGRAVEVVRNKYFNVKVKGLCLLLIAGGNRIEVLMSTEIDREVDESEVMRALQPFFEQIAKDVLFKRGDPPLRKGKLRKITLALMKLILMPHYTILMRKILEEKESTLIVPVHKLWREIEEKVKG